MFDFRFYANAYSREIRCVCRRCKHRMLDVERWCTAYESLCFSSHHVPKSIRFVYMQNKSDSRHTRRRNVWFDFRLVVCASAAVWQTKCSVAAEMPAKQQEVGAAVAVTVTSASTATLLLLHVTCIRTPTKNTQCKMTLPKWHLLRYGNVMSCFIRFSITCFSRTNFAVDLDFVTCSQCGVHNIPTALTHWFALRTPFTQCCHTHTQSARECSSKYL